MSRKNILRECFRLCDKDCDGLLTTTDLERISLKFNKSCPEPEKEAQVIMQHLDHDKDGFISEDEWIQWLNELFHFMSDKAFEAHCNELKMILLS